MLFAMVKMTEHILNSLNHFELLHIIYVAITVATEKPDKLNIFPSFHTSYGL